ncbi:Ribonuclease J [Rhodovastum atsumiense]|uniref:Ribonuclease J n=1 Tax=Rhodovastum atsumiense TaxID=504468 RepID=A0A5M6J195_9PROT|nr:ribonuclease J [Rhodovastum atsumiense]KAA5614363.1 ribonuclease J [Rhodovastum atsumiense]CAH2604837.1 Ribonuclease J [Rhodovastum atsumiense]
MTRANSDLAFVPLGGTGEIGMNLNLYRCGEAWLAVDCGIGFGGAANPEVDIMLPDPAFIAERRDRLVGLVLTHAHEDHLGGVAHLWRSLRCPVFATPFAASVLRRKLGEAQLISEVPLRVIPPGGSFTLEPFRLQFINMAHSIPEAQALVIRTHVGTVLHTGDWKLDPDPLVGGRTDEAALAKLGEEGVLAMICDSTNALVEGHSGSEADVREAMTALVRSLRGRVAVTCFASNVARLETIALAAQAAGRTVALVGRSLRNIDAAARECGYLKEVPPFATEDEAADIPDDNLLLIVTGSQGEPRSALARIALDQHPRIELGEGDTVVFSSRVIPGNERAIITVQDNLVRRGVRLMTDADHMIHVSGHPARDELRRLYRLVRPPVAVPVHGEWRHLTAHAELAQAAGIGSVLLEDGDILNLAPGRVEVVDSAPVGRLVLDGNRLVPMTGGVMGARRRMLFNGVAIASIAVDEAGRLRGRPRLTAPGLFETEDPEMLRIADEMAESVADLPAPIRRDDATLQEAAKTALRRALGKRLQKRPLVDVLLLRI